jgi:hypothetical protein
MPKVKYYIILAVLVCVGLSLPAGAECWSWSKKNIPGSPTWDSSNNATFMVYDQALEKMALTIYRDNGDLELWTFDGITWVKVWAASPELPPHAAYGGISGLYYDGNLRALVILSHFAFGHNNYCDGLHKFVPGQGWRLVQDCFDYWGIKHAVFDTNRKRAVIVGGFDWFDGSGKPYTIEFDGWNFYYIKNPEDFRFTTGKLGYDPETQKIVFFGYVEEGSSPETYEYDGTTWTKIACSETPPLGVNGVRPPWGFPYIPELKGLLFIPGNFLSEADLWRYKDHNWKRMHAQNRPPGHYEGLFSYSPVQSNLILYGGFIESNDSIMFADDLWILSKRNHCRPVLRP